MHKIINITSKKNTIDAIFKYTYPNVFHHKNMRPRVDIYSEPNFKGKQQTFQTEGKTKLKESFTHTDMIGKTFYLVHPFKSGNKEYALDNSGINKSGSKFHLYEWSKDNINQIFTMLNNGVIKCVGNGMVLDVINGSFKNGTNLHNYPQNNTDAQLWTYDSNTRMLKLKNKNFCLNIHNYKLANRAEINIWQPNGHESQMWDIRLCEVKEGYSSSKTPSETFTIGSKNLLSLSSQRETFNTCMANLHQHTNRGGESTGWVGIGDYDFSPYAVQKNAKTTSLSGMNKGDKSGPYSSQFANIGDFREWVGKKFIIRCRQNTNFVLDTRGFQNNGRGDDSGYVGIWSYDPNQVNQIWTVDAFGHLGPACNRRYILGAPSGSHQGSWPKMVDNNNGKNNGQRWRFYKNSICHLGGKPFLHVSGAKMANGTRVGHWTTESARKQSNCTWILEEVGWAGNENNGYFYNDDISSVTLRPFTDIYLYTDAGFRGKVWHYHNGSEGDWSFNLTDVGFNDTLSSYKIRAGQMDNKKTKDNNDTSSTAVCNLRYKVHMANTGWTGWVENGQQAGKSGNRMEAIMFEYTGPGQMYARAHCDGKGWLNWVSSGVTCGTTGQSRKLNGLEFKIEGVSNVYFGLDCYANGKGWMSQVGLNKVGGTTEGSRQLELIKITASLNKLTATTPKGKTISLVSIPKNWVVTDMSIGNFQPLIGKPFIIRSRGNSRFVIDTEGHQNGGGPIKIYEKVADFHVNQTWTVDKDGHLISWQNRNSILYLANCRDGTRPTIIGWKGNEAKANSSQSKWRLNKDGFIESLYQSNQILDVNGGSYKNNTPIIIFNKHGGNNQKWDVVELKDMSIGKFSNYIGKSFIIRSRGNNKFVIDTEGHQNGGGPIKIYEKVADMHVNQTWTVDKDGHLISWQNRNSILYIANTNNSQRPTIIGWKGNEAKANSPNSKWRLNDAGQIESLASVNQVLDVSGASYKNNTPVIIFGKHSSNNQKWDIIEVKEPVKVDTSIGNFTNLVGKSFVIRSRGNNKFVIDTEGHQNGGGWLKIYQKVEDMHENQTWTVDKDGYIASWKNRDMVIYAGNLKNSQLPTITKLSSIPAANKNQARWRLASNGIIENIANPSFVLDVDSAGGYKNNTKIHVYTKHGKVNQLFDCVEVHEPKKVEVKPMIGSIILAQCTELIIYEAKTDSKTKPKKITIHNGMRYRPGKNMNKVNFRIDDFVKKYGVKSVKEIEIKYVDPDNKQYDKVEEYEGFLFEGFSLDSNTNKIIVVVIIVIGVVLSLFLYLKLMGGSIFGWYIPENSWMITKQQTAINDQNNVQNMNETLNGGAFEDRKEIFDNQYDLMGMPRNFSDDDDF